MRSASQPKTPEHLKSEQDQDHAADLDEGRQERAERKPEHGRQGRAHDDEDRAEAGHEGQRM